MSDPSGAIAAANAICARRNRELAAIPEARTALPAIANAARRRVRIEQRALGELERLKPPASVAAGYRKMVRADQKALLRVVKVGERAAAGDAAGTRSAKAQAGGDGLRLLVATAHTGLRECASLR